MTTTPDIHTHRAARLSVTAERLILDRILAVIEAEGAIGYSIFEGTGKSQHELHARARHPLLGDFAIVKIEVVMLDRARIEALAARLIKELFEDYAGIVYIDHVDVLRTEKFVVE